MQQIIFYDDTHIIEVTKDKVEDDLKSANFSIINSRRLANSWPLINKGENHNWAKRITCGGLFGELLGVMAKK